MMHNRGNLGTCDFEYYYSGPSDFGIIISGTIDFGYFHFYFDFVYEINSVVFDEGQLLVFTLSVIIDLLHDAIWRCKTIAYFQTFDIIKPNNIVI